MPFKKLFIALQPIPCDKMDGGEALRLHIHVGYHGKYMTKIRVSNLLARIS